MLRAIVLFALSLVFFVPNTIAAEISQFVPTLIAPVPISEELLNGDVVRLIYSVEYAEQNSDAPKYAIPRVWEKVCLDDTVTPPSGMTFLIPQFSLRQNAKPYYRATSPTGEKYTCFLIPPAKIERGMVSLGDIYVLKYDARGRIRDMNFLGVRWNSTGTGFRFTFEYGDEEDCQEVRLYFRKDEEYVHEGKEIAAGEDVEICLIEFQYENGRLKKYFSNDSNYFISPEKTELTYDEHGFLASKAEFQGPDALEPGCTWFYRNYEQDHLGNWTRRDVYFNELLAATENREIYYAGDLLPDCPEDSPDTEIAESESGTEWIMDFASSISWLLSCTLTFCSYEFFPAVQ